jgi:DNA-directed RNA polymerase alpha subunit
MAKCLSSVCAVSHIAEREFLQDIIPGTARRALEKEAIDSLEKLSEYSEDDIRKLHGFGETTMKKLKIYMQEHQVQFKSQYL